MIHQIDKAGMSSLREGSMAQAMPKLLFAMLSKSPPMMWGLSPGKVPGRGKPCPHTPTWGDGVDDIPGMLCLLY
jgi:hypothetical protein